MGVAEGGSFLLIGPREDPLFFKNKGPGAQGRIFLGSPGHRKSYFPLAGAIGKFNFRRPVGSCLVMCPIANSTSVVPWVARQRLL